ncbi:MAG: ABC transporter substrate-binding protein [Actinomycetota bacterium]|nr:ABC transporter substrate-binding protein [Actinomycetota bacterium]
MKRLLRVTPIAVVVLLVSTVSVGQRYISRISTRSVHRQTAGETVLGRGPQAKDGATSPAQVAAALPPARAGLECARGRNGGATDTGVTGAAIKLGAAVVKSGPGASFLGQVPIALEAVVNHVNRAGGICGRLLELSMKDDKWNADDGERYIRNFIAEGVFALAVSPSSEGLDAAIRNNDISKAGIPVVGADGMLISQYTNRWVFPVAASTITAMHAMAKDAAARGAKTFGLVYEKTYHFGVEGASAFRGALKRLFPGRDPKTVLKADEGIEVDQAPYKTAVDRFNTGCHPCDFVAMLLEPPTALQWIRDGGSFGSLDGGGTGGPQPLFVDSFARNCGTPCNGMWVWSGYHPPVAPFDDLPGVVDYVNTVRSHTSSIDVNNPFVEGGYLGMQLLVKALQAVGPDLTRARLRTALETLTLATGLTQPLRWASGDHFANNSVHAFSVVVNAGSFAGWRYEQTNWVTDPWPGLDAPKR